MKKVLLTLAITSALFCAQAQQTHPSLEKGKWFVETNLSPFSLNRTTGLSFASNDGSTEWSFGGEAGIFAADKLAVKLGLGVNGTSYDSYGGTETETVLSYKIGAKYFISNVVPIQIDFGGLNSDGENAVTLGTQIGYAWFIKDNIALEPALRYDHGLNDNASEVKTLSARIGFSLFF